MNFKCQCVITRWHFSFGQNMEIDSCFKIGFVLRTHGLKGEVTVSLEEDTPSNLFRYRFGFSGN